MATTIDNVRLVEFTYTYAISDRDDGVNVLPGDMDQAIEQAKRRDEAFAPTPAHVEDGATNKEKSTNSTRSSANIPLHDIERVLPIYLRVYYKEDEKTKRALIEYEVKNNETLYEMLAVMLRKLKALKGKKEAVGRFYYTQRKFRNPAELDFNSYAKTVIEDLAEMGKSMFFVFDMAGRLDSKETAEDSSLRWVIALKSSKSSRSSK
ncbi:hypothetical protein GCK32_015521 [Trichostrongylus colubriformis]|uniref:Uncharacterized protein n=1 Tax=Trichostrongylus colubriformis TaxID=6319 RepID=A0AAN8G6M5_TRICO